MPDAHDAAVEAMAGALHDIFGGKIGYCYHESDCPEPGMYYKRCEKDAERVLAALQTEYLLVPKSTATRKEGNAPNEESYDDYGPILGADGGSSAG